MDEEFVQTYLNKMAGRVNELQQENLLLKAQLDHANLRLQAMSEPPTEEPQQSDYAEPSTYEEPEVVAAAKKVKPENFPKGKKESLGDKIRRETTK